MKKSHFLAPSLVGAKNQDLYINFNYTHTSAEFLKSPLILNNQFMVSQKLLNELRDIIKDEYGRDLTMAEVSKIGNDLVNAFDILAKIDYAEKNDS